MACLDAHLYEIEYNKLKHNETIICENFAVVNVEWKKYPAAIVYLVDNTWIT
jgi:hypothetical protein